ncbi:hypothetical protein BAGA_28495 [Bacillus gaemokensis]|uniref:Transmembrane protein n=1 Tax=Bacillus gaemokensis TaxID=574375 RepID=A0A073KCQ8_9BACI|nr:hypothetical protein BAGA_28495 [Bacillus gaemokensis]KYG38179.1 hypothetical protein AZF08_19250 [Bacillus gaemokensis]
MSKRCIFEKEGHTNGKYKVMLPSLGVYIHLTFFVLSWESYSLLIRRKVKLLSVEKEVNDVWRNVDGDMSTL